MHPVITHISIPAVKKFNHLPVAFTSIIEFLLSEYKIRRKRESMYVIRILQFILNFFYQIICQKFICVQTKNPFVFTFRYGERFLISKSCKAPLEQPAGLLAGYFIRSVCAKTVHNDDFVAPV